MADPDTAAYRRRNARVLLAATMVDCTSNDEASTLGGIVRQVLRDRRGNMAAACVCAEQLRDEWDHAGVIQGEPTPGQVKSAYLRFRPIYQSLQPKAKETP